jgi:hypothetical protein
MFSLLLILITLFAVLGFSLFTGQSGIDYDVSRWCTSNGYAN